MNPRILAALCLPACVPEQEREGIAVGNPGTTMTARLLPGDDVVALDGTLEDVALTLLPCDGAPSVAATGLRLPVDGGVGVTLPDEVVCGLRLGLGTSIALSGSTGVGGNFTVLLDVPAITVRSESGFDLGDGPWLFQLGPAGWLDGRILGLEGAGEVAIGPESAQHLAMVMRLTAGSRLIRDADGDGYPGEDEEVVARPGAEPPVSPPIPR